MTDQSTPRFCSEIDECPESFLQNPYAEDFRQASAVNKEKHQLYYNVYGPKIFTGDLITPTASYSALCAHASRKGLSGSKLLYLYILQAVYLSLDYFTLNSDRRYQSTFVRRKAEGRDQNRKLKEQTNICSKRSSTGKESNECPRYLYLILYYFLPLSYVL